MVLVEEKRQSNAAPFLGSMRDWILTPIVWDVHADVCVVQLMLLDRSTTLSDGR
jgi:hypothetical protein